MNVRAVAICLSFAAAVSTSEARAASVELSAAPLLGAEAPGEGSWQAFSVRLRAAGKEQRGTIELTDGTGAMTRAPFAVAPGEQESLELYTHDAFSKSIEAVARDEGRAVLARSGLPALRSEGPLLVDLGRTGRLETALRGERVAVDRIARPWAPVAGMDLATTHALVDARTGELVLPDRGLGYGSATVVLVPSDVLGAMPDDEAAALMDWVYAGGSLAVTISEGAAPTGPRLAALFGGAVSLGPAPDLASNADFQVEEQESPAATAAGYVSRHVAPDEAVAQKLVRVSGGKLAPTRWGSSRQIGLGEVHALGFDPTSPAFVDDAWVRRSVVDLVRVAWDRRDPIALGGGAAFDELRTDGPRRLLDPNEGSRWSIWVSAIVLVIYALLAGPLSFRRAARRGAPLGAFVELPIWSFGAATLIVLVGMFAKGGRSRARRLSFVECREGESRARTVRFRALFASSADTLHVAALDPSSLLDVAASGPALERALVLGRGTAELVDLHGRPWETVLVREDGMTALHGAVRFIGQGPDLSVENGFDRDLLAVVAQGPGLELRYFPRLGRGERVRLDRGRPVTPGTAVPVPLASGAMSPPHRLDAYRFAALADADVKGTSAAWSAIESAGSDTTDYWPDDRPALVGELEGGDGALKDTGLTLDYDRVFVRVLGDRR